MYSDKTELYLHLDRADFVHWCKVCDYVLDLHENLSNADDVLAFLTNYYFYDVVSRHYVDSEVDEDDF